MLGPILNLLFSPQMRSGCRTINATAWNLGAFPWKGAFKRGPEPVIMLLAELIAWTFVRKR